MRKSVGSGVEELRMELQRLSIVEQNINIVSRVVSTITIASALAAGAYACFFEDSAFGKIFFGVFVVSAIILLGLCLAHAYYDECANVIASKIKESLATTPLPVTVTVWKPGEWSELE